MISQPSNDAKVNKQTSELHIQLATLLNKVLNLMGDQLFEQIDHTIIERCKSTKEEDELGLATIIEDIVKFMVRKLEAAQLIISMDITKQDYEALESTLQKKEAEIRNHFRIEMQQKLYETELQESLGQLQLQLLKMTPQMKHYQERIRQLQLQLKTNKRKLQTYQERMYELNRGSVCNSLDKKSSQKLMQKASSNLKNRTKVEPYLQTLSKSKKVFSRYHKEGSKLVKDRGSRILCFESIKAKQQSLDQQEVNPPKRSISHHNSKILSRYYKNNAKGYMDLNLSVQLLEGEKKKGRAIRQATEIAEQKDKEHRSVHI